MTNDKEKSEQARILFAQECECILAAAEPGQFPDSKLPEVAFIGRSNVGKSSLINALTGRNKLARASNTPGRTQQIVFFNLGEKLMLVDLPGYGHAVAPVAEKEQWNELVQYYMRQRRELKIVCLLIDGRHGVKANDAEMMEILDRAAVTYKIILTKLDQVKPVERAQRLEQVAAAVSRHPAALDGLIATSSEDKLGIDSLREYLAGVAAAGI